MKTKKHARRTSLEGAFTAIARAQSKHWGIQIVASGSQLSTDGKVIYFPWNADDIDGIPFPVLNGYLDHEVGHIAEEAEHNAEDRITPLTLMRKSRNPTKSMLLNVFEDIRMEIKRGKLYPGVASNLHAANLHSVETFRKRFEGAEGKAAHFWHTLGCGIILEARGCSTEWMPEEYAPFMALVRPEIEDSQKAEWGQDSWDLACRVFDKVRGLAEELIKYKDKVAEESGAVEGLETKSGESEADLADEDAASGTGSSGDEGEDAGEDDTEGSTAGGSKSSESDAGEQGEASNEVSGEAAPEAGTPSGAAPEGDSGEAPCGDADKASEIADGAFTDASQEHIMDEVGKEIKQASEDAAEKPEGYLPDPLSLARDRWIKPAKGTADQYNAIKSKVAKQVSALRAKLVRVIRTRTESRAQYDQDHGALDTSNLHQLRLGNKRVFSETIQGEELDTAVSILVDMSGSMGQASDGHSNAHYARMTTVALAETFRVLNVPFEVIGFHNTGSIEGCTPGPFQSRQPFEYHVFKSFSDNHRQVRGRLVNIDGLHNNADGEAVLAVAHRLAVRPESRKLYFVISDGQPACAGLDYYAGSAHLKKVIKQIRDSGIHIFGIGMRHDSIAQYYGKEHSICVNNFDTMAANIFKVMREKLVAGLRSAA